jgi:hypothetical protein
MAAFPSTWAKIAIRLLVAIVAFDEFRWLRCVAVSRLPNPRDPLLMQSIRAEQYKGKRVRLSGFVKSQTVVSWAGLWMRVDQGKDMVAIDNMQDRPVKGTTDWQRYDVVLNVPPDSTGISFGILLDGAGEVWLSSTKFDVVGADVPVTGAADKKTPDNPVNLDFTE